MKRRWQPSAAILAIDPTAFFGWWDPYQPPANELRDGVALVHVRGPLEHHHSTYSDSYEDILGRVREAIAAAPRALVMAVDSPGGLALGMDEAAREIRAACNAAGVPLIAYVKGMATSAAYGLACVADEVVVPPSGWVGSVGTLLEILDTTEAEAKWGVKVHVFASGARKTDTNPNVPMTPEAGAALSAVVSDLANVFCALVAEHRAMPADAVRALEAGIFVGSKAVDVGLVDRVEDLSQLIARLTGAAPTQSSDAPTGALETNNMDDDEKKFRESLQAIIDDDESDEKAKDKAKAKLAALDEAGSDDEGGDDDDKPTEAGNSTAGNATKAPVVDADARLTRIEQRIEAAERAAKVNALLDARPDLSAEQRKAFAALDPKSLETVLAATPRQATGRRNPAAELSPSVRPTQGRTSGTNRARAEQLRASLSIGKQERTVENTGTSLRIGARPAAAGKGE